MIVLNANHKLVTLVSMTDLQAHRLFVLTDVDPVIANHPCHFGIYGLEAWNVAGTDRLMDDVKRFIPEHAQVIHGCVDCLDLQASPFGFLIIQLQHGLAEINNGHIRARGGIKDGLPATARGEAQDIQPGNRSRQPAATVERPERLPTFCVRSNASEQTAGVGQVIPGLLIIVAIVHSNQAQYSS